MEKEALARVLVAGSAAIDRMRREIDYTIREIVGLASSHSSWPNNIPKKSLFPLIEKRFSSPRGSWLIQIRPGDHIEKSLDVDVTYFSRSPKGESYAIRMRGYATHIQPPYYFSPSNILALYQDLPFFIEEMTKIFPSITEHWQPLLDAADFAEQNGWQM